MSTTAFSSIERALNESQALREHAAMERARSWQERYPQEDSEIESAAAQESPVKTNGPSESHIKVTPTTGETARTPASAADHPMFNFHSHHQFHDDKPEERADRFTPTSEGDLTTYGSTLRQGS